MNEPTTLEEALAIIESLKMCGNCKYFYDWASTIQMCLFGKSKADRATLYKDPEYQRTWDCSQCENWENGNV